MHGDISLLGMLSLCRYSRSNTYIHKYVANISFGINIKNMKVTMYVGCCTAIPVATKGAKQKHLLSFIESIALIHMDSTHVYV